MKAEAITAAPLYLSHLSNIAKMGTEIWKNVKGYESLYQVNNFGKIKSLRFNRLLSGSINSNGYKYMMIKVDGKGKLISLHRLIANTFIPNPENKKCVNHIDGNKLNNDLSNLEWCTYSENAVHAFKINIRTNKKGIDNNRSKKVYQYSIDNILINIHGGLREASRNTGLPNKQIWDCCNGLKDFAFNYKWSY